MPACCAFSSQEGEALMSAYRASRVIVAATFLVLMATAASAQTSGGAGTGATSGRTSVGTGSSIGTGLGTGSSIGDDRRLGPTSGSVGAATPRSPGAAGPALPPASATTPRIIAPEAFPAPSPSLPYGQTPAISTPELGAPSAAGTPVPPLRSRGVSARKARAGGAAPAPDPDSGETVPRATPSIIAE
jgi:hypothetical protein